MKKKLLLIILSIFCIIAMITLSSCQFITDVIFGGSDNPDNPQNPDGGDNGKPLYPDENPTPSHTHKAEHKQAENPTCTGNGNVEYWYCAECGKYFADEKCEHEITDVTSLSTGHAYVILSDDKSHWQQCKNCGKTMDVTAHSSDKWQKNGEEHYKTCDVCQTRYASQKHTMENGECSVCGYFTDYIGKCASRYGYDNLNDIDSAKVITLQKAYSDIDKLAKGFHDNANAKIKTRVNGGSEIKYIDTVESDLTIDEMLSVWSSYVKDHPLYYWLSRNIVYSQSIFETTTLYVCVFDEFADNATRIAQNKLLYSKINDYLNIAQNDSSAYYKTLAIHDEIIKNINYASQNNVPVQEEWAHSIIGVLTGKGAVCEGYAKTAQLLLTACGLESVYVTGDSRGVGHAWNAVKLDDERWYWLDVTWDDQPSQSDGKIYDYFCCFGDVFKDHTVYNRELGINYQYVLPDISQTEYENDAIALVGYELVYGEYIFTVSGYNSLAVSDCSAHGLSAEIPQFVENNGRIYSVTKISAYAFDNSPIIREITIPQSVVIIENFAFYKCPRLEKAVFADTSGWERTGKNTKNKIDSETLQNPENAAKLLTEYEKANLLGTSVYQYIWIRTAK